MNMKSNILEWKERVACLDGLVGLERRKLDVGLQLYKVHLV